MEDKIDAAIEKLAELTKACQRPLDAMQYSQAALSLAQAKDILVGKSQKSKGAGS